MTPRYDKSLHRRGGTGAIGIQKLPAAASSSWPPMFVVRFELDLNQDSIGAGCALSRMEVFSKKRVLAERKKAANPAGDSKFFSSAGPTRAGRIRHIGPTVRWATRPRPSLRRSVASAVSQRSTALATPRGRKNPYAWNSHKTWYRKWGQVRRAVQFAKSANCLILDKSPCPI